ncbi:MAG: DUF6768 family protein [Bacteroidota bacterium]
MIQKNDPIEALIREALEEEQEEVLRSYDEMNVFEQTFSTFKGKNGWASMYVFVFALGFWVATMYSLVQAIRTEDTIFWLLVMNATLMMLVIAKLWFWMEINRRSISQEIKILRMEMKKQEKARRASHENQL